MKKALLFLISMGLLQSIQIHAQNLLNYTFSSNGEKGYCLFPEDSSGNVAFSSLIDVQHSADTIMMVADEYIMSQNVSGKCVVECLSKSTRTSTYSIQLNIGKQSWGIEYWGTPLFIFNRDASHVKFKCVVEARTGKYKYSLIGFETNRNTIRGEAKNDGQPNVIHWQRVNSLTKERDAYASTHDSSKREVKEKLFDFNSQIAYEACLYQAEYDATKRFEDGLKNLNFEDDFMDLSQNTSDSEKALNKASQGRNFSFSVFGEGFFTHAGNYTHQYQAKSSDSNYSTFSGFLLQKGNNVYVAGEDTNYEQAGVQELIKQIMIDGFWNVVDDIHHAHFVIKYVVSLEGRDKAHLLISTPDGDIEKELDSHGASESSRENHEIARSIYLKSIMPLYKLIDSQKFPKDLRVFTK